MRTDEYLSLSKSKKKTYLTSNTRSSLLQDRVHNFGFGN